ncbi:MAG TPA: transketolase, partial [Anaerolineaceae bacterium]|nr:transketolase [Anaerolineaceae bacterium]
QDETYRNSVLLPQVEARLAVEAGVTQGWHRWVGARGRVIGLDRYGASAPAAIVFEKLGFSVENIEQTALEILQ